MRQFRKRTLALILASAIAVAGSFAAENYKNSLMRIDFRNNPNGELNVIFETKNAYTGELALRKRSADTYMIMLPDMDSSAPTPQLQNAEGLIESVKINTMPYSESAKGYTKVVIKAHPSARLVAVNKVYLQGSREDELFISQFSNPMSERQAENYDNYREPAYQSNHVQQTPQRRVVNETAWPEGSSSRTKSETRQSEPVRYVEKDVQSPQEQSTVMQEENVKEDVSSPEPVSEPASSIPEGSPYERVMVILGTLLIITLSSFFVVRAKNKLKEIAGDDINIDASDEEKKADKENKKNKKNKKNKSIKDIKKTIKSLDSQFGTTSFMPDVYAVSNHQENNQVKTEEVSEELNIIDLDGVLADKEKVATDTESNESESEEEDNSALEDFLNGFSLDEDAEIDTEDNAESKEPEEEIHTYDEEYYNSVMNNPDLKFSSDDIECINQIINDELTAEAVNNISKYLVSNPVKKEVPKSKVLEDLISMYTITRNVTFNKEDREALRKLINVEIDQDFLTNLTINPELTRKMDEEIKNHKAKEPKPQEILTLNVSGILPDISEELKHVDKNATKPSDPMELSVSGYDVAKLNVGSELPNLADILAHPEKYEDNTPKATVELDEEEMLNRIMNVQFKPFDDGTREFEILNDFSEETINSIENEFNSFENFEIARDDSEDEQVPKYVESVKNTYQDPFENLYIDLDKRSENFDKTELDVPEIEASEYVPLQDEEISEPLEVKELQPAVEDNKEEIKKPEPDTGKVKKEAKVTAVKPEESSVSRQTESARNICMLDGESYSILKDVKMTARAGCYLTKNNSGYAVLGYMDDNLATLKKYADLKNENIRVRQYESLPDGRERFIIRIGENKFITDVKADCIEYVMDL